MCVRGLKTNFPIIARILVLGIWLISAAGCAIVAEKPLDLPPLEAPQSTPESAARTPTPQTNGAPIAARTENPNTTRTGVRTVLPTASRNLENTNSQNQVVYYPDVWDEMRAGFTLPEFSNKYVTRYEKWLTANPAYFDRLVERARPFLPYIVAQLKKRNMPLDIALLPAVESAFRVNAYSRAGASGLWQFMPATGRSFGLYETTWYSGRKDIVQSTRAALDYLLKLEQQFNGNWFLALSSYNAGENGVKRAIAKNRKKNRPTGFNHLPLKSETLRYVPKLLAYRNIVRNPERFGLSLKAITNEPYFTEVDLKYQTSLSVAAEVTGISSRSLSRLNPALKHFVTPPEGPHRILVPIGESQRLLTGVAKLNAQRRLNWAHYKVRKGDVLGKIARRYGVTVSSIRQANKLRSDRIGIGQNLLIPSSRPVAAKTSNGIKIAKKSGRNSTSKSSSKSITYSVKRGDTLWGIARQYQIKLANLLSWNGLDSNDILSLGQRLVIRRN